MIASTSLPTTASRLPSDSGHRLHPIFPSFQVHQYAVDNHNSIVYQHPHRQHESRQRDTLHRSPGELQEKNDPKTVTTKLMPIIRPLLNPIASIRINTTMTTDSIRLMTNVPRPIPHVSLIEYFMAIYSGRRRLSFNSASFASTALRPSRYPNRSKQLPKCR